MEKLKTAMGSRRLIDCRESIGSKKVDQNVATAVGYVFIYLRSLCENWETSSYSTPHEKIIRDFNYFLFSGEYNINHLEILSKAAADLEDKYLDHIQDLLNYYKRKLKDSDKYDSIEMIGDKYDCEDINFKTSIFVYFICLNLANSTSLSSEKKAEFFIQKEFNDWDLESIDQNSFWGIWWFIDQKNSESEMSIAELKRNKTGDLSGPIMAEMNDGVFTINKRSGEKIIFGKNEFSLGDEDNQKAIHKNSRNKILTRWSAFRNRDKSLDKGIKGSEIQRIINLEKSLYDESLAKRKEGNLSIGKVVRHSLGLIIAECLNQFMTLYIRKERVGLKNNSIQDYEDKIWVLTSAIFGYYINFYREHFYLDVDKDKALGLKLCKQLDEGKNYLEEIGDENGILPLWLCAKHFPEDFKKGLMHLKKINMEISYCRQPKLMDLHGDKINFQHNDFVYFINGISSGLLYPDIFGTFPVPSKY